MSSPSLLARISRDYLRHRHVSRWHMRSVGDMTDAEVIRACHWYCQEHRLTDEWEAFRRRAEDDHVCCPYRNEYITRSACCDLQMAAGGHIKSEDPIDKSATLGCCAACPYQL